ncbi:hypothetical protein FQN60_012213, partial [Etheostoma spectabile]
MLSGLASLAWVEPVYLPVTAMDVCKQAVSTCPPVWTACRTSTSPPKRVFPSTATKPSVHPRSHVHLSMLAPGAIIPGNDGAHANVSYMCVSYGHVCVSVCVCVCVCVCMCVCVCVPIVFPTSHSLRGTISAFCLTQCFVLPSRH